MIVKNTFIKLLFAVLIVLSFSSVALSQTPVEARRVEENKRKDLQATENPKRPGTEQPPSTASAPMRPLDRMYFLELITKRITYHYDLCKMISLLLEKENEYITLDAQIMLLKENHFLPRSLEEDFPPQQLLRKGVTAYIFTKALGIKGGWSVRVFGLREHNAINELVYEGIMPAGNARDIVSGEELISIFTQAVNYRKNNAQ